MQVSFNRVAPTLLSVGDFQRIRQNFHVNLAPGFPLQFLAQALTERQKSVWIVLLISPQIVQGALGLLHLPFPRRETGFQRVSGVLRGGGEMFRCGAGSLKRNFRSGKNIALGIGERRPAPLKRNGGVRQAAQFLPFRPIAHLDAESAQNLGFPFQFRCGIR